MVAEVAGHSKVHEQSRVSFERDDQVFPAPIERSYALAGERVSDRFRRLRPSEPKVVDLDLFEPPASEQRLEPPPDRLDLGELRHG